MSIVLARTIRCNQALDGRPCPAVVSGDTPADRLAKMGAHVSAAHGVAPREALARAVEIEREDAAPDSVKRRTCPEHPTWACSTNKAHLLIDHVEEVHEVTRDQARAYVETLESGQTPIKAPVSGSLPARCLHCKIAARYPSQHAPGCPERAKSKPRVATVNETAKAARDRWISKEKTSDGSGVRGSIVGAGHSASPGDHGAVTSGGVALRGQRRPGPGPTARTGADRVATNRVTTKAQKARARPGRERCDECGRKASSVPMSPSQHRRDCSRHAGAKKNSEPRPRPIATELKRMAKRAELGGARVAHALRAAATNGHLDVAAEIKRIKAEIAERQARLDEIRKALDGDASGPEDAAERTRKARR